MKLIRAITIILLTCYGILLPIYLGIICPEYWACRKCIYEGAMGTDIWGNSVQCFGDSKAFGEAIFQFSSFLVSGLTAVLIVIFLRAYYLKRNAKINTYDKENPD